MKTKEEVKYCECSIYLSNGRGECCFCNKPMKPLNKRKNWKMTNKNYLRGRSREYRTMNKLKEIGYKIVLRSAGSHSPIDVVGIKDNEIRLIQCKPKSLSEKKRQKILSDLAWLQGQELKVVVEVV